jgi:hypothetical protein
VPGATGAALDAHRALGHLRADNTRAGRAPTGGSGSNPTSATRMASRCRRSRRTKAALFLETVHAHYLGELDGD